MAKKIDVKPLFKALEKSKESVSADKTPHTPGPWSITKESEEQIIITANNQAACIAYLANWYGDLDPKGANARLIAEAPELLETVKTLLLPHMGDCQLEDESKARALVARITGE